MAMSERSECVFDPARTSLMTAALEASLLKIKPSRTDAAKSARCWYGRPFGSRSSGSQHAWTVS
jgi:hypothetical protein